MDPKQPPSTPEEVLAALQDPSTTFEMAEDQLSQVLDPEVQEIFAAIWWELTGKKPKRGIWASDRSTLSHVLDTENGVCTPASLEAVEKASAVLGISLAPKDRFVDAALRLRSHRTDAATKV